MTMILILAAAAAIVSPDAPKPYEATAAKELGAYLEKCVPSGKVTIGADATGRVPPVFAADGETSSIQGCMYGCASGR